MNSKLVAMSGLLALVLTACGDESSTTSTTSYTTAGFNETHCVCPEAPPTEMDGSTGTDKLRYHFEGAIWESTDGKWTPLTCPPACPTNTKLTRQYEKAVTDEVNRTWKLSEDCHLSDLARGKAKREILAMGDLPYSATELVSIVGVRGIGAEFTVSRKSALNDLMAEVSPTALKASWTSFGVGCGIDPKTNELLTVVLFNEEPSEPVVQESAAAVIAYKQP